MGPLLRHGTDLKGILVNGSLDVSLQQVASTHQIQVIEKGFSLVLQGHGHLASHAFDLHLSLNESDEQSLEEVHGLVGQLVGSLSLLHLVPVSHVNWQQGVGEFPETEAPIGVRVESSIHERDIHWLLRNTQSIEAVQEVF